MGSSRGSPRDAVMGYEALFLVAAAFAALTLGYPVAFTLGGVAILTALLAAALGLGDFAGGDFSILLAVFQKVFALMDSASEILIAVPMFILMGVVLERAKIAEDLLRAIGTRFQALPGGLALAVILVGALLAASTGIVGATVVTMGLVSLPTMLRAGYHPPLAAGTVAASGTLGQIIPPSIVLVILGDMVSREYVQARRLAGDWAPEPVTVADLFAGALVPGLMLTTLYALFVAHRAWRRPERAPRLKRKDEDGGLVDALLAPLALITVVLGSILAGVATPLEAASLGAVGALLLAGARRAERRAFPELLALAALFALPILTLFFDLRIAAADKSAADRLGVALAALALAIFVIGLGVAMARLGRAADPKGPERSLLMGVGLETARMSAMVFAIFIAAQIFNVVFKGLGGDDLAKAAFETAPGGPWGALFLVMALIFLLGFFLDFLEILFVAGPIVLPILFAFVDPTGAAFFDPIWLAILLALNLQTSFLTPPFGFALFYLRGAAPKELSSTAIWRGALPFVGLQILAIALVVAFPLLATGLPAILR